MSMSQPIEIPQHIDDPKQFLLWTIDDAIPFVGCVIIGNMMGYILISAIVGFTISFYYRRFRESNPDGILQHAVYWFGLYRRKSHIFPDPLIKQYLP